VANQSVNTSTSFSKEASFSKYFKKDAKNELKEIKLLSYKCVGCFTVQLPASEFYTSPGIN
jgi:hypothetical protein